MRMVLIPGLAPLPRLVRAKRSRFPDELAGCLDVGRTYAELNARWR